jgi:hypothetical protein
LLGQAVIVHHPAKTIGSMLSWSEPQEFQIASESRNPTSDLKGQKSPSHFGNPKPEIMNLTQRHSHLLGSVQKMIYSATEYVECRAIRTLECRRTIMMHVAEEAFDVCRDSELFTRQYRERRQKSKLTLSSDAKG